MSDSAPRFLLGLTALLCFLPGSAASQVEFYQEGNRLYQEGDFQAALSSYQRVIEAGLESGEIYYNVGNSYFKLGDLAQAILNYERARRLLPGDEDVRANLDLARSLTADEIEPRQRFWVLDAWSWWVDLLPRSLLIIVVALAYVAGMGGAVLLVMRRGSSAALWGGRVAFGSSAVLLVLGLNLAIRELGLGQAEEAVVMAPQVDVRSAPVDDETLTIFTVHEGTKVQVGRRAEEWAEVVLEDGKVGWVRVGVLETI
jgi:tetratricopeptide (TPR) repeat protein